MTEHDEQNKPTGTEPLTAVSIVLIMVTVVLWAGTPVAIRYSTAAIPPVSVAAIRFALAALFMLAWVWAHSTSVRLRRDQIQAPFIAGVLMFLQISTFTQGVHLSNASHGSILINTFIFGIVAIEHFVTKANRLTTRKTTGLLLAASGITLVLLTVGEKADDSSLEVASLPGDLLLVLSAGLLAVKISYTKHSVQSIHPDCFIFWHHVFGTSLLALYAAAIEKFDPRTLTEFAQPEIQEAWLGLLYQGLAVAGLCFAIQARLLRRHSAASISVFSFATPLFGILFAVVFRGDPLSGWLFLAGAAVAGGIFLVNTRSTSKSSPST